MRGLHANLETMTQHTTEASEASLAVTITHTQEGPAGRTETRMGNTEADHKGRLTRSQSGQRDLTLLWMAFAVVVLIVIGITVVKVMS